MIISKNDRPKQEPIPVGLHKAVCYSIVDYGTQETAYGPKHQMKITFELPDIRMEYEKDGKMINSPRVISTRNLTISTHERSNMGKLLKEWLGTPSDNFDTASLLGLNAQLFVVHNEVDETTYANIQSIVPLSEGMEHKQNENPLIDYEIKRDGTDFPPNLPDWQKDIITKSPEYKNADPDNEIPF